VSEPAVSLSVASSDPPGVLSVDDLPALKIAKSRTQACAKSPAEFGLKLKAVP